MPDPDPLAEMMSGTFDSVEIAVDNLTQRLRITARRPGRVLTAYATKAELGPDGLTFECSTSPAPIPCAEPAP